MYAYNCIYYIYIYIYIHMYISLYHVHMNLLYDCLDLLGKERPFMLPW